MKKLMTAVVSLSAMALSVVGANASTVSVTSLEINDQYYVGYVTPGTPKSGAAQESFINELIELNWMTSGSCPKSNTCYRSNELDDEMLPGALHDPNPNNGNMFPNGGKPGGVDITGYAYVLGSYSKHFMDYGVATSHIWYVGGLTGLVLLPDQENKFSQLGEITRFMGQPQTPPPPPPAVPDGGTSVMLLGSAMVGLGMLRRKFGK
jgi:hypothetical protein